MNIQKGLIYLSLVICSCSPLSRKSLTKAIRNDENKLQDHIGFQVYDPASQKVLFEYQHDHYFTPASNTKVLTLFASLKILKDSIPALRYYENGDSLIFWGLGDPSFLYKETFNNFRVYDFLSQKNKSLYFSASNFHTTHFGRGWAWDDYNDYYSPERSSLPVYGNTFSVFPLPDQFLVVPKYFQQYSSLGENLEKAKVIREISSNKFSFHSGTDGRYKDFTIPFHPESSLIAGLLQDTLHRNVQSIDKALTKTAKILYSVPADSLYRPMMQESDNHIAEQLLLTCSAVLSDSLKPEIAINYIQKTYFKNFSDTAVWVDGSGLSRYNLFTPRFMVDVWKEIFAAVPSERLFPLLATGGKPGTLKRWFVSEKPYVFGKTGTLSNNHCLSGFLVTKKGRVLIFALMHANYVSPVSDVRASMQRILNLYYEKY